MVSFFGIIELMEPRGDNRVRISRTKPSFSKEQRVGFGFAIGLGCVAFLVGLFYVGHHLMAPFALEYNGPAFIMPAQQEEAELQQLRVTDSDEDGLVDFDELYVFKSSPYLFDTDGDGYDDGFEVENGTDPTCPEGLDCSELETTGDAESEVTEDMLENADRFATDTSELHELVTGLGPDEIRELFIEAGMSEEDVNQLSDEDVTLLYQSMIAEMESSGELDQIISEAASESSAESSSESTDPQAWIDSLSAEEMRQMLIESGADEAKVAALSEEELRAIFQAGVEDL